MANSRILSTSYYISSYCIVTVGIDKYIEIVVACTER